MLGADIRIIEVCKYRYVINLDVQKLQHHVDQSRINRMWIFSKQICVRVIQARVRFIQK